MEDINEAIKLLEENGYKIITPEEIKKYWNKFNELTKKFINAKTIEKKEYIDKQIKELKY